ncbi:MAG: DNA translocase FtsK 4TM domain-containing protein [Gammaproteobacteria bacterium]|nr:DNA translocase FtsK 4TM domain-containing protein [Gammaproteobacteria bacterium]
MRQATPKKPDNALTLGVHLNRRLREGALILVAALALYLVLSLLTYTPSDPGWSYSGTVERIANRGGVVGAWIADVFLYLFGYLAYLFPVMVAYSGWLLYRDRGDESAIDWYGLASRTAGFILTLAAGCGLASLHFLGGVLPLDAGGVLGDVVGRGLAGMFSPLGATLILLALFLTGITLFTSLSWFALMDTTGYHTLALIRRGRLLFVRARDYQDGRKARRQRETAVQVAKKKSEKRKPPRIEPVIGPIPPSARVEKERQVPLFEPPADSVLPPLSLLDPSPPSASTVSKPALEALSRQVEMKLLDFGIEVQVVAVHPGPVVTRFELQPAPGLKVSRITNLAKDLARSLSVTSVRIVEVIPGKSVIGLEIPNERRDLVVLSEILKSRAYDKTTSPLTLALGKDISGQSMVVDLARMPHLLVAGTTGSGKSVAINAMVLSLLYKATPADVRLIMVDPKMLELSVYQGIPHLLAPVVTDMKEAANALRWCVGEMERRYRLMSALGVRNISGYNRKVTEAAAKGQPIADPLFVAEPVLDETITPPSLEPLPLVVVIIDELADMMMIVGKKVEELIARLAQKARASGIHLLLATQRPSVDVITGLIKANIPTRIAFQVSSKVDSRTILDQMGAEQLLGHGDMLYLPPGTANPVRVHGAFVSDQEVHRVVSNLKSRGEPAYLTEVLEGGADEVPGAGGGADGEANGEQDPLYDDAVRIVTESRRASISGVQRRLKIGYNRAARMIEEMERAGVVGNLQPNGSREVLAPPPPEA